jgi:hypothetical protein
MQTGSAQQRIVEDGAERRACGQLIGNGVADDGEDLRHREAVLREKAIGGAPVLKPGSGSGEQTSHSVASKTKQGTQREGSRPVGDATPVEGGEALVPELFELREAAGRVFLEPEWGPPGDAAREGTYLQ